jgi:hypothetical protein
MIAIQPSDLLDGIASSAFSFSKAQNETALYNAQSTHDVAPLGPSPVECRRGIVPRIVLVFAGSFTTSNSPSTLNNALQKSLKPA